jgi:hypothetical protein
MMMMTRRRRRRRRKKRTVLIPTTWNQSLPFAQSPHLQQHTTCNGKKRCKRDRERENNK